MKKENLLKITDLRHELHMYPELSMQERDTAERIKRFLRDNTHLQIVDRGNWFYAFKEGKNPGQKIAFRADMDALPIAEDRTLRYHSRNAGVSHKCGHDGHCAALCGLALELDKKETESDIYLIFQPGEETGRGALLCRELIREEGITQIFAFHNLGGYSEGSVVYRPGLTQPASEGLRICFTGKASHASAPEEGVNPSGVIARVILRAEELLDELSSDRSGDRYNDRAGDQLDDQSEDRPGDQSDDRPSDRPDGMLLCTITGVSVGTGDFGISPGEGELSMTLRAEKEDRMKYLERQIIGFAEEEAKKVGLRTEWSIHDYFPETRNDARCLAAAIGAASDLGMNVIRMKDMWRASEDFGWYLKECPGAIVYIGNGEDYPPLHTVGYDFNDRILEKAVDLFAALA
ncbi:MAG: M20/M25/M40 family metallo-hydrolase [Lachnospiraceae bacterium]|nr:M20/M25/M40 family metallo-hydrolase [Lachnospiraceae bacterium]